MLWRSSPHNASPTLCDMILPARQSGVTEARLKRIVHVELSVRSSGDVKYDGWISSNVPPADETLELVYNRGQLHVRHESYWLLAVVQLLRSAHPLLVHHDSLLLSHAPVLPQPWLLPPPFPAPSTLWSVG